MERISRSQAMMQIALVTARRGTCSRLQVGAVFSIDGRIVVNGYNGAPKGQPHCNHTCNCNVDFLLGDDLTKKLAVHDSQCASVIPCTIAQHAERNAIDFAAKHGLSLNGTTLHVTDSPCVTCAGSLLNVGVETVFYLRPYRVREGLDLLERSGIQVLAMSDPGMVN